MSGAIDLDAIEARAKAARDITRMRRYCRDCGMDEPPEKIPAGFSPSWASHDGCKHPSTLTGGSIGTRAYTLTGQGTDGLIADVIALLADARALRTRADAAEAERARLRAIVEGRAEAPDDAEIAAHAAAGGSWLMQWSDGSTTAGRGGSGMAEIVAEARDPSLSPGRARVVRWWPLDATGRPTTWPAVDGASAKNAGSVE